MEAHAQGEAGIAQEQPETANDMRHGRGAPMELYRSIQQDEWNADDQHGNTMLLATYEQHVKIRPAYQDWLLICHM
jgi:hypothetical protein